MSTARDKRNRSDMEACTFVVEPAQDVADTWVGYCLDLDVVSYAPTSPQQALTITMEAALITIEEDRKEGRDPFERGTDIKALWSKGRRVRIESA